MAKAICSVCLKNEIGIGDIICNTCHEDLLDKPHGILKHIYNFLVIGDRTSSARCNGIKFDASNWDQHWDVVKRRLEEGTEDRFVVYKFLDSSSSDLMKPVRVNSLYLYCEESGKTELTAVSFHEMGKHWHFVDRPKSIGFLIELKKDDNNHTCRCGHRMYIGLSGALCEACGAFNC